MSQCSARAVAVALIASATLAPAVYGSSSSGASGNSAGATSSKSNTSGAESASSSQFTPASLQRAQANLKSYLGHPSPIPVTQPLKRKMPAGSRVVYMNCQAPECESFVPSLAAAARVLGLKFSQIPTGSTATTISAAFDTAAQEKPAAVIDPALDPVLWPKALATLRAAHIPVVANAIPEPPGNGIVGETFGIKGLEHDAALLADYIYTKEGNKANVLFVLSPDYTFTVKMAQQFQQEFSALCPSCHVALLKVPASTIGTTLPSRVVSALQASPQTNWIAAAFAGLMLGVPSATTAAGLHVKAIDANAVQQNYQYVKAGQESATLAVDYNVQDWTLLDEAERAATGQAIPAAENGSLPPSQILTKSELTFDPSHLWVAYPNYQQTFKRLWGVK